LGLAFKPNADNLRESPEMDIIARLSSRRARVRAHHPIAVPKACLVLPAVSYSDDPCDVAEGADALLLATEWDYYLSLDWQKIVHRMRRRIALDGRNSLNGRMLAEIGFTYLSFGRLAVGKSPQPPLIKGNLPSPPFTKGKPSHSPLYEKDVGGISEAVAVYGLSLRDPMA